MVSIELSFGEIEGAMEPVVRSTDAIAHLDTVSSEIDQLDTHKNHNHRTSTDAIRHSSILGKVKESKVMRWVCFSSGLLGCEREELWNSKPTN